jgi:FemAB-related protein (PEP-CTERM system-associated)
MLARPVTLRFADLADPIDRARVGAYVHEHSDGTPFHLPAWSAAVASGCGQTAHYLVAERDVHGIVGVLPLTELHSPLFGRVLASSGFAVEGGAVAASDTTALALCRAAEELAERLSCATIEVRGGPAPAHWTTRTDSHCGFEAPILADDAAQLAAIPRKQRAEVRKGLANDLAISVGRGEAERRAHYAVYAESVRNLGTPVFPQALFAAVLEELDADILTVSHRGEPVASVLSLYHGDAVLPYWGGGTVAARALRANDRMYFELMRHARGRRCARFDFGRSKTGSGAYAFKKNWGFEPRPLSYSSWTAPGAEARDADPTSARHAARIALWKRLPLPVANRLGPAISRGLG